MTHTGRDALVALACEIESVSYSEVTDATLQRWADQISEVVEKMVYELAATLDAEQQAPPTPHLDPAHSDKDPPHPTHNFRPSK